ncbi:hypothetical protein F4806DRAFT_250808 [Annulohypoxylon nitens]|nr:hypothetical protein F4806DRAFT_250808 [Annulohypoxylon nitens]
MSTAGNEDAAGPNIDANADAPANDAQPRHSSHSRASTHRNHHTSASDQRVPFFSWWVVGGKGRPPTKANLLRMAHERNEVARKAKARAEARKKAQAERNKYLQNWEKQWGDGGLLSKVLGSKPPDKKHLGGGRGKERMRIEGQPRT